MTAVPTVLPSEVPVVVEDPEIFIRTLPMVDGVCLIPDVTVQARAATAQCGRLMVEREALEVERKALEVRLREVNERLRALTGSMAYGSYEAEISKARRQTEGWDRLQVLAGLPVVRLLSKPGQGEEFAFLVRIGAGQRGRVWYRTLSTRYRDETNLCSVGELGDYVIPEHATKEAIAGYRKAIAARVAPVAAEPAETKP